MATSRVEIKGRSFIPEAKSGETLWTAARRCAELGFDRFVHNDRVHKLDSLLAEMERQDRAHH